VRDVLAHTWFATEAPHARTHIEQGKKRTLRSRGTCAVAAPSVVDEGECDVLGWLPPTNDKHQKRCQQRGRQEEDAAPTDGKRAAIRPTTSHAILQHYIHTMPLQRHRARAPFGRGGWVNTQCGPFFHCTVGRLGKNAWVCRGAAQGCIVGARGRGGDATGAMRVGGRCNLRVDPLAEHLGDGCRACATGEGKQVMCACVGGEFLGVEECKRKKREETR
jgi:hypothetical protein